MRDEYQSIGAFLAKSVSISIILIVFLIGITYISEWLLQLSYLQDTSERIGRVIISSVIVLSALFIVAGSRKVFELLYTKHDDFTSHQQEVSYRFTQITVYISALFLIVSVWEVDLSNVLLGAGVLGLLVGLAARNALSSVLSGIIIMSTNMFKIGHWVAFNDKFGQVEKITFFNTHIISPQREKHIIPNEKITAEDVTNMSGNNSSYRVDLLVDIDYSENIETIIELCDEEIHKLKEDETSVVFRAGETTVKEFGDSGITLSIKVWINQPNPYRINSAKTCVIKQIHERFDKENITIPFPQRTISHRTNDTEER